MKILMALLALAATAGAAHAQKADSFVAVHPYIAGGNVGASRTPRFWTRSTIALAAIDGAAKAADSYITRRNMDGGGAEYNPLARPFVRTTGVQVPATAALFGAEMAAAYLLHRRHHDHVGQAFLAGGAVMNGLGAASSYEHRVKDW